MDELKMDELELPDLDGMELTEPSFSKTAESTEKPQEEKAADNLSLDDISVPILSEMDGSESPRPQPKAETPKPVQPKPTPESPKPASTYQSTYTSPVNDPLSSMDRLYEVRNQINAGMYEKGKKKASVIAIIGIIVYGLSTISGFFSMIDSFNIGTLLDLGFSGVLLYFSIKFLDGSDGARKVLGYVSGVDFARGLIGLFGLGFLSSSLSMLDMGSLSTAMGIFMKIIMALGFLSTLIKGIITYFLLIDSDVAEYTIHKY